MTVIRLSISPKTYDEKIAGGDREAWADLYRNLVHVELDEIGIADAIHKGHIIAPVLDGWRSYDHFIAAQHIGIDMDTEDHRSAMSTLIDHDLVQMYGAIIYATPSSTPTAPRSRLIFLLDQPITDPYKYKAAVRTLSRYFPGHDNSSAEATRTWFGNSRLAKSHTSDGLFFKESHLPLDDLRMMYVSQKRADEKESKPAFDYTGAEINVGKMVKAVISQAAHGQRNSLCYWMACRLVEDGVPTSEQEKAVRQFAQGVTQDGGIFDEAEALQCLRSARAGA